MAVENEQQSNSVLEGIKQGSTLGVTEMADSTPSINEDNASLLPNIQVNENLPPEQEVAFGGKIFNLFRTPKREIFQPPSTIADDGSSLLVKEGETVLQGDDLKVQQSLDGFDNVIQSLNIDFNSINTAEDFAAVIQTVVKKAPDPGTETNEEVFKLAKDLDVRPSLLFGKGFSNATEVYAARNFLKLSNDQLIKLADEVIANPADASLALKFKKHLTLHGLFVTNFQQGRADVGRALRAFQLPTMADAPSQASALEEMINTNGGLKNIVKIAEQTKNLFDKSGMPATNKFIGENYFKRSAKAWSEAYRGGLLFSPKTQLRNLIGNAFYVSYSVPEYILAGAWGNMESAIINGGGKIIRGKHWGGYNNGMTWEMGVARLYGMVHGFKDALRMGAKGFHGQTSDAFTKYEGATNDYFTAKNLGLENSPFAGMVDFMGKVYRLPYKGLTAGDEFFKEMARSMEMHTIIMNDATKLSRNTGISYREAWEKTVTDVMSNPGKYQMDLDDAARYYTFQDQMPKFLEEASRAIQSTPYVGTILLPFAKTPVNVTRRFLDMTTGGLPKHLIDRKFFTDATTRSRVMARIGMSASFAMLIADFHQSGHITGGYPLLPNGKIDMKAKAALDAIGWKPYSFVFRGEGFPDDMPLFQEGNQYIPNGNLTYVSYQGLEPVGALIGVNAHVQELMHRNPDPNLLAAIADSYALAIYKYMGDMPMVQGMADITAMLTEGKFDDVGADVISNMLLAPIAPLAPIKAAGGVFQGETVDGEYSIIARNKDVNFERDMNLFVDIDGDGKAETVNINYGNQVNSKFFNPFIEEFNSILFSMPYDEGITVGEAIWGKTQTGKDLPPKLDIFGQEIKVDSGRGLINEISNRFINPFAISDVQPNDLHVYENIRLDSPITNPQPIKLGVKLKPDEYYNWIRISKNAPLKIFDGLTFEEEIIRITQSDEYLYEMNNTERNKILKDANRFALEEGFEELLMLPEYRELSEVIDIKKDAIEQGLLPNQGVNILQ